MLNEETDAAARPELKGVSREIVLRSFFLETLWNYDGLQNVGFVLCMYPVLKRFYPALSELKSVASRHQEQVNTHPAMSTLLVGMTARLERDVDPAAVMAYRKRIMAALAAHGDRIFWSHVKPLAAVLGVLVALGFAWSAVGSVVTMIVYNAPNLYARMSGFSRGWTKGFDVLESFRSPRMDRGLHGLRRLLSLGLGLTAGLLVSEAVRRVDSVPTVVAGGILVATFGIGLSLLRKRAAVTAVVYALAVAAAGLFCALEAGVRF